MREPLDSHDSAAQKTLRSRKPLLELAGNSARPSCPEPGRLYVALRLRQLRRGYSMSMQAQLRRECARNGSRLREAVLRVPDCGLAWALGNPHPAPANRLAERPLLGHLTCQQSSAHGRIHNHSDVVLSCERKNFPLGVSGE
jgi:hypothetical protein